MKRKSFFLMLCSLLYLFAYADETSTTARHLLDRNGVFITDSGMVGFLRSLCGDTITFNITEVSDVDIFSKELPDTVWMKKRPKKNPKEGKHYRLSYIYKGEPTQSGEYRTLTSNINGKPFGVLSVDNVGAMNCYSLHKDILIKLIDLEDLSVVTCRIPHDNKYSFSIASNKIAQDIQSIMGKEFYIKTGDGLTAPKYTLCSLNGGEYTISFDTNIGEVRIQSNVKLNFIDKDGLDVVFNYEKPYYDNHYMEDIIVSRSEHEDKYAVRIINSNVDYDLVNSEEELPFDFLFILATRNGSSAYISQQIVPGNIKSYSWTSDHNTVPEDKFMFVGGVINVRNTKFYKMIYNGKAFFMLANDVKLSQEDKLKLDSLENSSCKVQELFWHKTLLLNQILYYKRLDEALKKVKSYSKYGLAIERWSIYDESEYTDGTGIRIKFLNPTEQMIKYISITFQGYNAVNDPYGRPITRKCIGPIEPQETASYEFEYVWFSDIVEYAKIRSITVTYKNGSSKTIANPSSIMLSDEVLDTIFVSDPVEDFE